MGSDGPGLPQGIGKATVFHPEAGLNLDFCLHTPRDGPRYRRIDAEHLQCPSRGGRAAAGMPGNLSDCDPALSFHTEAIPCMPAKPGL